MSWSATQLKYQLIRISEILVNWSRFSAHESFERLFDINTDLLVEQLDYQQLENIKSEFWNIILKSGDLKLYGDLKTYFDTDEFTGEPTSMTSVS